MFKISRSDTSIQFEHTLKFFDGVNRKHKKKLQRELEKNIFSTFTIGITFTFIVEITIRSTAVIVKVLRSLFYYYYFSICLKNS